MRVLIGFLVAVSAFGQGGNVPSGIPLGNGGGVGTTYTGTANQVDVTGSAISTPSVFIPPGSVAAVGVVSGSNINVSFVGPAGTGLVSGGALGTPASGNGSNLTNISLTAGVAGVLPGTNGGTGVNNSTRTMTYAGNVAFTGAFNPTFAIPATGTYTLAVGTEAITGNPLSQFAATTSAQLLATLTDPTGTGPAVFGTSPTLTTPAITTSAILTNNGIGAVSSDGWLLQNTTAAAVGAQQFSPRIKFAGNGWKTTATAASQALSWSVDLQPVQASTNPDAELVFAPTINGVAKSVIYFCSGTTSGANANSFLIFTATTTSNGCNNSNGFAGFGSGAANVITFATNAGDRGNFNNNGIMLSGTSGLLFANGAAGNASTGDTSLDRDAAGILGVYNGTAPGTTLANYRDLKLRFAVDTISSSIASAATIAPTTRVTHITGTTQITTITVPTNLSATNTGGCIVLIPDGLWTTATGGNIALASTATVNRSMTMCYDTGTTSWYPSY